PPTTALYTLSLHDALPIFASSTACSIWTMKGRSKAMAQRLACDTSSLEARLKAGGRKYVALALISSRTPMSPTLEVTGARLAATDRKSTRLNSSHVKISYA